jgi:iron complex transport system ATP-binding protein
MQRTPVIEASNLVIGYVQKNKERRIVHDSLQFQLFAGELTSLLGLNGAGKSTLLRTICGFQPSLGGQLRINGRLLSDYSPSELSRVTGIVLTEKTNAGGMTVHELVSLGRHPYTGFFGTLKAEDKRIVTESLEAVGISNMADRPVSELSDGERQKAMIAKAFAQQCPLILLDEPTAYLDVTSRIETMSLLRRLAIEQHKAILLSTHDLDLAIQMSDCLWLLERAHPLLCGTPEDLILNGSFKFLNKRGIAFDPSTGKLTADKPATPILVEGDPLTAYWVANALIRNGFKPAPKNESNSRIYCHRPNQIFLFLKGAEEIQINSIEELIVAMFHLNL